MIVSGVALAVALPVSASAATFGRRTLSVGMAGGDVVALQGDLTAIGFPTSVSGDFNRETIREVRTFQRRHHLHVDGVVGPATFRALRRALRREDGNHITEKALAASGGSGMAGAVHSTAAPSSAALPSADSGGVGFVPTPESAPEVDATLIDGLAVAAPGTPQAVVWVIAAANRIAFLPYIYGGGHSPYAVQDGVVQLDAGYDCSGSVSFALHGGNLLADPLDSEQFYGYGQAGSGRWITLYTKGSYHVLMRVAGLWFDTAAQSPDNGNDRWSTTRISPLGGYEARHPAGW